MADALDRIIADKRKHVAACKRERPLGTLEVETRAADRPRGA